MSVSTKIPLPPPPPSLAKPINIAAYTVGKLDANDAKRVPLDECLWASAWPELQKACYLARVCASAPPKECQYRSISGQLQVGPTCGLTALSMLLNGDPTAAELLKIAQNQKFTNNGELFSANYLYQLVQKYCMRNNQHDNNVRLYSGVLDNNQIRKHLMENACIFVPPDLT